MLELRNYLEQLLENEEGIMATIIEDTLKQQNVIQYLEQVINDGCVTGIVEYLVQDEQSIQFYNTHVDEILDIYDGCSWLYEGEELTQTELCWLAYEHRVEELLLELDSVVY